MNTITIFNKQQILEYQSDLNDDNNRRVLTSKRELRRIEDIVHIHHYFPTATSILCIGARDDSEIQTFINYGFDAKGIDICTESKLITKMDVAELSSDFGTFDIVYCSHVLEHVVDAEFVFHKIKSIVNQALFIILPIVDRKPDIEHPTVYEIMKHKPVTNFKNSIEAWKDFQIFQPYYIPYNCYRNALTEDYEIAFILGVH